MQKQQIMSQTSHTTVDHSPMINLCEKENEIHVKLDFTMFSQNFEIDVEPIPPPEGTVDRKYILTVREDTNGSQVLYAELTNLVVGDNLEIEVKDYPMNNLFLPENKGKIIIKFETVKF